MPLHIRAAAFADISMTRRASRRFVPSTMRTHSQQRYALCTHSLQAPPHSNQRSLAVRAAAVPTKRTVVIVESPTKADKIRKFLAGSEHGAVSVFASKGHFRNLPSKPDAVAPERGFDMRWEIDARKSKQLSEIVAAAKVADTVVLATDPDREGEAISWHLQQFLQVRRCALCWHCSLA